MSDKERTCEVIKCDRHMWRDEWETELSCGHRVAELEGKFDRCPVCGAMGPGNSDQTEAEAIEAWNTRAERVCSDVGNLRILSALNVGGYQQCSHLARECRSTVHPVGQRW